MTMTIMLNSICYSILIHQTLAFFVWYPQRVSNSNARQLHNRFEEVSSSKTRLHQAESNNNVDMGFNLLGLANGVIHQGAIIKPAKEGWKFAWQRMMTELAPQDRSGNYRRPSHYFDSSSSNVLSSSTSKTSGRFALDDDEIGRYNLYVGNPCPWCHRTRLALGLLGISDFVGVTVLEDDPIRASRGGWIFSSAQPDPLGKHHRDLRQLYDSLSPGFRGRCTAPLLVDKKRRLIISNESSDIVRLFNALSQTSRIRSTMANNETFIDLFPREKSKEIDATNDWVYTLLNNGVYRCGFSTTQSAYNAASLQVREGLDRAESILERQPYLCGNVFTEADLRLLPTVLRYDGAYAPLFRAGGAHLKIRGDFPAIHTWLQRCWAMPGVASSIDLSNACASYYKHLFPLNPGGIIPTAVTPRDLGLE